MSERKADYYVCWIVDQSIFHDHIMHCFLSKAIEHGRQILERSFKNGTFHVYQVEGIFSSTVYKEEIELIQDLEPQYVQLVDEHFFELTLDEKGRGDA